MSKRKLVTKFLDLSRVSYAMTSKLNRKRSIVEVGFTDLEHAEQFHQYVVERSKQHQRMTPLARAATQAKQFVDELTSIGSVSPELRAAIEARFVYLISEKNEQGKNAVELFDECRRLRNQLASVQS